MAWILTLIMSSSDDAGEHIGAATCFLVVGCILVFSMFFSFSLIVSRSQHLLAALEFRFSCIICGREGECVNLQMETYLYLNVLYRCDVCA